MLKEFIRTCLEEIQIDGSEQGENGSNDISGSWS